MSETKRAPALSRSTLLVVVAIVGAAAFALGRNTTPSSALVATDPSIVPRESAGATFPPGHPPATGEMPPGHPPVGQAAPATPPRDTPASTLEWTAPARWQKVPSTSAMRLATYKIPRAPGDAEDAELSVIQAGGSVAANVDRWSQQFADDGKRASHTETRKVAGLAVTIVEIEGTYGGGMGQAQPTEGWGLLGAIVETPDMPHFFKMTGPVKSVKAARGELDALVQSVHTQ